MMENVTSNNDNTMDNLHSTDEVSVDGEREMKKKIIYLEVATLKNEEVSRVIDELKKNGARFNAKKKKWYVKADMDLSKFKKYLPAEIKDAYGSSNVN